MNQTWGSNNGQCYNEPLRRTRNGFSNARENASSRVVISVLNLIGWECSVCFLDQSQSEEVNQSSSVPDTQLKTVQNIVVTKCLLSLTEKRRKNLNKKRVGEKSWNNAIRWVMKKLIRLNFSFKITNFKCLSEIHCSLWLTQTPLNMSVTFFFFSWLQFLQFVVYKWSYYHPSVKMWFTSKQVTRRLENLPRSLDRWPPSWEVNSPQLVSCGSQGSNPVKTWPFVWSFWLCFWDLELADRDLIYRHVSFEFVALIIL